VKGPGPISFGEARLEWGGALGALALPSPVISGTGGLPLLAGRGWGA